MDESLAGIAFGAALVTILLTPLLTTRADKGFEWLHRRIPKGMESLFETYQKFIEGLMVGLGRNLVLRLVKRPILQIVLYFFIINGIFITASIATPWVSGMLDKLPFEWAWKFGYWLGVGLVVSPFLIAVLRNLNAMAYILTDALFGGRSNRTIYQNRLRQLITAIILGAFLALLILIFLLVAAPYLPNTGLAGAAFLIMTAIGVLLRSRFIFVNSQMEILFAESFRAEVASREEQRRDQILKMIQQQTPWPVEIVDLTLPSHAAWSGKLIRELNLRARFGVNVLALGRGYSVAYDPSPEAPVFSGDRLVLSGSHEAIEKVREAMQAQVRPEDRPPPTPDQFRMEQVYVAPKSELDGHTLADGRVRVRFGVTVIGVQRGEERISNPGPDFLLAAGDVLMVAGLPSKIEAFASSCEGKPLPVGA